MMKKQTKKTILIIVCIISIILLIMGCQKKEIADKLPAAKPSQTEIKKSTNIPEPTSKPANKEESSPKLSGEITDLPTLADIESVSGKKVTSILASDALEYELPLNENFAVALRENITKGVRWLLVSEDGNYKLIDEQHINGYRVFIFSSDIKGETNMVYELESGGVVAETLSYHLFLGTPGGDR